VGGEDHADCTEQLFDTASRTWAARLGLTDAFEAIGGDRSAWDARRPTSGSERPWPSVSFGAGLLARGAQRLGLRRLTGVGAGRRCGGRPRTTIDVAAPGERRVPLLGAHRELPAFHASVREVKDLGGRRSHWKVAGPLGSDIEWDAEQTVDEPNRLIGWKTVAGSIVEHAGIVRFRRRRDGGTRVRVRLSYNPIGGASGHGVRERAGRRSREPHERRSRK
jgi:hypothetical protein